MLNSRALHICVIFTLFISFCNCSVNQPFVNHSDSEQNQKIESQLLNFIVIGDWGDYKKENQKTVADEMDRYAAQHNSRFIISTGDNFYPDGVRSTSDSLWNKAFLDVYNGPALKNLLWISSLGNHDYRNTGNASAQVEYSQVKPERWYMPYFFYDTTIVIDESAKILFVVLDTNTLLGEINKESPAYENPRRQLDSLDAWLRRSDAEWKFVVGHHPVYSVGHHGDNPGMKKLLHSRMKQTGAQAYFAGHDHNLQLFEDDSITYVVSGGGGRGAKRIRRICTEVKKIFGGYEKKALIHRWATGFAGVSIYPDRAEIQFVDFAGNRSAIHTIPKN